MLNKSESIKKNANDYLHSLKIVHSQEEALNYSHDVLLIPPDIEFAFRYDNLVETKGLGKLDEKRRDLIRVIKIQDSLNMKYQNTNILVPLIYAENMKNIPWHITTQGILFSRIEHETITWVKSIIKSKPYGKHDSDCFWLPFSKPIDNIKEGDVISIFNRRVAGWDGSHDRPVIELLGAGGHLPQVWDDNSNKLRVLNVKENLLKEFHEELGIKIGEDRTTIFGGYENSITHELVILCGIEVDSRRLIDIQNYAIQNIDEDTKGIYLGSFKEVIDYYKFNPDPFAGGAKTAPYNFPSCAKLMEKVFDYAEL